MKNSNRRDFLGKSLVGSAGLAIGSSLPGPWLQALARESANSERVLVVIQLSGGNDGLNTVIPYRDAAYRQARPKLGIPDNEIIRIDDSTGFHPSLAGVHQLVEAGRFSVIQGVGYARPNRSHFESMDIWHTCHRKELRHGDGWLGRFIAESDQAGPDSLGLHLGHEQQPLALAARGVQVPTIASIEQFRLKVADEGLVPPQMLPDEATTPSSDNDLLGFLQTSTQSAIEASDRLATALKKSDSSSEFPDSSLGEKLSVIARLIVAGLSTKVYYVTLDGFDTHSQQPLAHAGLLRQWSEALNALVGRLEKAGQADRVLVMTFSEFGRRVSENASQGTDHGAAAPVFLAGAKLPKPLIGQHPSLTDLDDGDLKFHTDFRSVYATIVEKWFQAPSQPVLGERFPLIDLV
ncbi:MAG: DUF1501 domain-containing protein [Pirellulaceae bacterium]